MKSRNVEKENEALIRKVDGSNADFQFLLCAIVMMFDDILVRASQPHIWAAKYPV